MSPCDRTRNEASRPLTFGLEGPQQVRERDAKVPGLALGVEIGPEVGRRLLPPVGRPEREVGEQVPHAPASPLGRVHGPTGPPELDRPEQRQLEPSGGWDGQAGECGAGLALVPAAGLVDPPAHVRLSLGPQRLEQRHPSPAVGGDLGEPQLGGPRQWEERADHLGCDPSRRPERRCVAGPQRHDRPGERSGVGEVRTELGVVPVLTGRRDEYVPEGERPLLCRGADPAADGVALLVAGQGRRRRDLVAAGDVEGGLGLRDVDVGERCPGHVREAAGPPSGTGRPRRRGRPRPRASRASPPSPRCTRRCPASPPARSAVAALPAPPRPRRSSTAHRTRTPRRAAGRGVLRPRVPHGRAASPPRGARDGSAPPPGCRRPGPSTSR